jgi:hypothetical protein
VLKLKIVLKKCYWVRSNLVVIVGTGSMMSVTSILCEEIEIELKKLTNYAVPVVLSWANSYSITYNIFFSLPFVPRRPLKNVGTQASVAEQPYKTI